jgi:hypothetical protein
MKRRCRISEEKVMKRLCVVLACIVPLAIGCSTFRAIFPETINVNEAVAKKEEMDNSNNPAFKYLITRDLMEKRVRVKNVVVKDVTPSNNIDYRFSVLVSVPYQKGSIDCYIYSDELKTISKLVIGKTRIDAVGRFGKFFTLLDEAYAKIEIVNADIKILEDK